MINKIDQTLIFNFIISKAKVALSRISHFLAMDEAVHTQEKNPGLIFFYI
jgi:hypothetical protein